ncbi:MAG: cellulase family glycosylhydrolase [Chitinophagaceae bacterium]
MKRNLASILFSLLFCMAVTNLVAQNRWTAQKANQWYSKQGWLRGCNFQPSTAVNQLEMFQAETFDTATINRELGMAEDLGFNMMRVFLHHLAWTSDKEGFKKRVDQYLAISDRHHIKTMLVFFDDCWNDSSWVGKQPAPRTGIHNSGWVRDPGTMIHRFPDSLQMLEVYVKDVLKRFKDDRRILAWDLYNEPGNSNQFEKSLPLLTAVFEWAREVGPSQPLTCGVWSSGPKFSALNKFQIENSDIISYHNYSYIEDHIRTIDTLKKFGRPLICTEYMARRNGSLFQVILPILKKENVGAVNWGFVSGKTNTIFAWDTPITDGREPALWFHDIYRPDGTAFSESEIDFIRKINGRFPSTKK